MKTKQITTNLFGLTLFVLLLGGAKPVAGACSGQPCTNPPCCNGDLNGDGTLDLGDAIFMLSHLFRDGPEPVPIVGGSLAATGQTECFDDEGHVIPCDHSAFPGQDGFYRYGTGEESRFTDNADGTVSDSQTGLMWQQDTADPNGDGRLVWPADARNWQGALLYCQSLSLAGHTDWRLPNFKELKSLIKIPSSGGLVFPNTPFTYSEFWGTTQMGFYWSSTSGLGGFDSPLWNKAYGVDFSTAACPQLLKIGNGWVRAVRTIQ